VRNRRGRMREESRNQRRPAGRAPDLTRKASKILQQNRPGVVLCEICPGFRAISPMAIRRNPSVGQSFSPWRKRAETDDTPDVAARPATGPPRPDHQSRRGQHPLRRAGVREAAAAQYRRTLQIHPEFQRARAAPGRVLVSMGQHDEGLMELRRANARSGWSRSPSSWCWWEGERRVVRMKGM
jgi:hypothetical protein